ncbi:MAG: FtsX-like permease family protein, partial [Gemmatimonadetes bacterium]|nr:FtsX-like permease family protein [Gemmatimonadota bacterium]
MRAFDRKLLRDLYGMRSQAVAIAFVVLAGVATYVSMRNVMASLERTLDSYYREYRFADAFATARRAPEPVRARLAAIPGVSAVETRVTAPVNLEVPGFDEPVAGLLVSVPEDEQPTLNRLFIREGRLVRAGREGEVVLNEIFAEAHGLRPGAALTAIVNGRRRDLTVVGVGLTPEHLLQIQPGTLFPDPERYGVIWMGRQALAAAYDMEGAFNDVAFSLTPGASVADVLERVDRILEPYGGVGAVARKDQISNRAISEEFRQLRSSSTTLPLVFLAVAAFLLNVVVSRLIALQREQVGGLKAVGYSSAAVGVHYVKMVLVMALAGAVGGIAVGLWLGSLMGDLYMAYYRFPTLDYQASIPVIVTAVGLTTGAAVLGVLGAVRHAVRLSPAIAMRPAPPPLYTRTLAERLGLEGVLDQPSRMIVRNLERQPVRSLLTVVGIASSAAILIMGIFFIDSIEHMLRVEYGVAQRENLNVSFTGPASPAAIQELAALPGVRWAEPTRAAPVRLRREHREYDTAIQGIPPDAYLRQVIDTDLHPIAIPRSGIVLTERLAEILHAVPGEEIVVEVREGARRTRSIPVAAITQQYVGLAAYMELSQLNRLVGNGASVSGALLLTDSRRDAELTRALRERPQVASSVSQERMIASFRDTMDRSMLTMTLILSIFAGVIAFGVVYNAARISLSERDRELASLR